MQATHPGRAAPRHFSEQQALAPVNPGHDAAPIARQDQPEPGPELAAQAQALLDRPLPDVTTPNASPGSPVLRRLLLDGIAPASPQQRMAGWIECLTLGETRLAGFISQHWPVDTLPLYAAGECPQRLHPSLGTLAPQAAQTCLETLAKGLTPGSLRHLILAGPIPMDKADLPRLLHRCGIQALTLEATQGGHPVCELLLNALSASDAHCALHRLALVGLHAREMTNLFTALAGNKAHPAPWTIRLDQSPSVDAAVGTRAWTVGMAGAWQALTGISTLARLEISQPWLTLERFTPVTAFEHLMGRCPTLGSLHIHCAGIGQRAQVDLLGSCAKSASLVRLSLNFGDPSELGVEWNRAAVQALHAILSGNSGVRHLALKGQPFLAPVVDLPTGSPLRLDSLQLALPHLISTEVPALSSLLASTAELRHLRLDLPALVSAGWSDLYVGMATLPVTSLVVKSQREPPALITQALRQIVRDNRERVMHASLHAGLQASAAWSHLMIPEEIAGLIAAHLLDDPQWSGQTAPAWTRVTRDSYAAAQKAYLSARASSSTHALTADALADYDTPSSDEDLFLLELDEAGHPQALMLDGEWFDEDGPDQP